MSLRVDGLEVSIGANQVCRDLSFTLESAQSLAILGRNGVGKSTLLKTLAGLRTPQAGCVHWQGQALSDYPPRLLAQQRGYCAQQQHDAFASTVLETALIGRHPHLQRWGWETTADRAVALDALARVGLQDFAARQVQTLSGGERQRLALATLLTQQPQLYLLDEPLSHLDLNHAMATLALLQAEAKLGKRIVAVLHEPNFARRHFDAALLLFGDGAWACGAAADVLNAENLRRLYGHPLRALQDNGEPWFIPE